MEAWARLEICAMQIGLNIIVLLHITDYLVLTASPTPVTSY